jgi:TRL-like protein family
MQRKLGWFVKIGLILFFLSGCAASAMAPVNGWVYSDVVGPLGATPVPKATRMGMSCAASYLGWVALGDAGIEAAKRSGGISEVASVDHQTWSVLGLYARFCTLVRGN